MFDPYHKWLGILPKDQPPNHYRLLSVEAFESDLDVIEGAADRQMGFIRQYQAGEYAALAAKLLNEIAAARLCLMKATSKAAYDAKLRTQLAAQGSSSSYNDDDALVGFDSAVAESRSLPKKPTRSKRKKSKSSLMPWIAGGAVTVVLLLLYVSFGTRGGNPPEQTTSQQPAVFDAKNAVSSSHDPQKTSSSGIVAGPNQTGSDAKMPAVETPSESIARTEQGLPRDEAAPPPAKAGADKRDDHPKAPVSSNSTLAEPLPNDTWIDLLERTKFPDHGLLGTWKKKKNGTVTCDRSEDATFIVPVAVQGSYEINCEFARNESQDYVALVFPLEGSSCLLGLSLGNGAVSGFTFVDDNGPDKLPRDSSAVTRPGKISNKSKHKLLLDVKQDTDEATLTATLDDKQIASWTGDPLRLSCPPNQSLPLLHAVGVAVNQSQTDIHRLELRVKGDGKAYGLGNDWQRPLHPVEAGPPADIADKCVTWNGRKYLFSEAEMTLPQARTYAVRLRGRLLTISSAQEEAFLLDRGRNRYYWLSGWRRQKTRDWRDERDQPLRYLPKWAQGQPNCSDRELELCFNTTPDASQRGLHDCLPTHAWYVCVEWGDE